MSKASKLYIFLILAIFLSSCVKEQQYNFSLKNTLAIFLLNDNNKNYFCIPVQYVGDYQINDFEFTDGYILIGEYEILLKKDEINISLFFNKTTDEYGINQSDIFIEKYLSENDMKNIINENKKRNVNSRMYIGYNIVIDNEPQNGNGLLDDFELYKGVAIDPSFFPANLDFFKAKYLHK